MYEMDEMNESNETATEALPIAPSCTYHARPPTSPLLSFPRVQNNPDTRQPTDRRCSIELSGQPRLDQAPKQSKPYPQKPNPRMATHQRGTVTRPARRGAEKHRSWISQLLNLLGRARELLAVVSRITLMAQESKSRSRPLTTRALELRIAGPAPSDLHGRRRPEWGRMRSGVSGSAGRSVKLARKPPKACGFVPSQGTSFRDARCGFACLGKPEPSLASLAREAERGRDARGLGVGLLAKRRGVYRGLFDLFCVA